MQFRRALSLLVALSFLAGCASGAGPAVTPPATDTIHQVADPFPSGISAAENEVAHYVIEYGTDSYGAPEGDVRQVQEPSMVTNPQPGAGAIITYPDGSQQIADGSGAFDAAQSEFAANHALNVQNPFITVLVQVPSQPSLGTFSDEIVAPSPQQEAEIWSAWEPAASASSTNRKPQSANEWSPCAWDIGLLTNYVKPGESRDVTVTAGAPWDKHNWTFNSCTDLIGGQNGQVQGQFSGAAFAFTLVFVTWYKFRYTAPNSEFKYDHVYDYNNGGIGAYVQVQK